MYLLDFEEVEELEVAQIFWVMEKARELQKNIYKKVWQMEDNE